MSNHRILIRSRRRNIGSNRQLSLVGRKGRSRNVPPGPIEEGGPVWGHFMASVVLPPREFSTDQLVHGWHHISEIVAGSSEILFAKQSVNRSCENARHKAAVGVHPFGVPFFDQSVADEARSRSAEGDEFMRVNGDISCGFGRIGGAVFDEVAGHPIEFPARKVLYRFTEDVSVKFCPTLARRANKANRDPGIKGLGNQGGLAVTRNTFDSDLAGVHVGVWRCREIVDQSTQTPSPSSQCPPIFWFAGHSFVAQANDSHFEMVVVGLDRVWVDGSISPTVFDGLVSPGLA